MVVPTPIGNLDDITVRALKELRAASLVLAEDTRHTRQLLAHHHISARLLSYHQHNKRDRLQRIMEALQVGDVALVSNAGTPSISDPGFELVQATIQQQIEVDVLPGACAAITAVVGAAIAAPGFLFYGFLPRRSSERQTHLRQLQSTAQALVFYEAPHRVVSSLRDMLAVLGDRDIVIAREMTKLHQEWVRGSIAELCRKYAGSPPRGEITIVVAGSSGPPPLDTAAAAEHLRAMRAAGADRKSAIEDVARTRGLPRNEAYRIWLSLEDRPSNPSDDDC